MRAARAFRLTPLLALAALLSGCAEESTRTGRPRADAEARTSASAPDPAADAGDAGDADAAGRAPAARPARHAAPAVEPAATLDSLAPLAPPGAPAARFPTPDRPVAAITSDHWSNESARDRAGEAATVTRLLGIREGMRVADIGAGSGYYTARLSPVVGADGLVIATDVVAKYLEGLRERVREERLGNVALGLGDPHDPRLPEASVDVALLIHMYHEIEQPYAFLYNLAPALRPGARVGVVDLDRATTRHGTPQGLLRCEMAAVGYRQVAVHDLGKAGGYLAVFEPPRAGERRVPTGAEVCQAA